MLLVFGSLAGIYTYSCAGPFLSICYRGKYDTEVRAVTIERHLTNATLCSLRRLHGGERSDGGLPPFAFKQAHPPETSEAHVHKLCVSRCDYRLFVCASFSLGKHFGAQGLVIANIANMILRIGNSVFFAARILDSSQSALWGRMRPDAWILGSFGFFFVLTRGVCELLLTNDFLRIAFCGACFLVHCACLYRLRYRGLLG